LSNWPLRCAKARSLLLPLAVRENSTGAGKTFFRNSLGAAPGHKNSHLQIRDSIQLMRGRRRTPLAKAAATGRTTINPGRYAARREPYSDPLANPSPCLDELERKAWGALMQEIGWLTEADRCLMEIACKLRASIWRREADTRTIAQLRMCLSSMGATPVDRSKMNALPHSEPDPSDEFLN